MVEAPIFHATGTTPKRVVYGLQDRRRVPAEVPQAVVVDMFSYRRHGHNEGDEPAFTQPLMYKAIANHPTTLEIYGQKLVDEGLLTVADIDKAKADWRAKLEEEFEAGQNYARTRPTGWMAPGRA